jgi:hypothetical protein
MVPGKEAYIRRQSLEVRVGYVGIGEIDGIVPYEEI